MKKFPYIVFLGLVGIVCYFALNTPRVIAAPALAQATPKPNPANSGQALEIAPPVITLVAKPGETIKTQISLRNISSGNLLVNSQVNDFVAAGEDGTPKILLEDEDNNPYSLKGWIPPTTNLLMVPRQIRNLPVTINVPANASPGGHYGVIRFTATPPELNGTGVSLSASLGSLLLITVSGKTVEGLNVEELSVSKGGKISTVFESTPLDFSVRLKNTGNSHVQPVGQIAITDMFGKKVAGLNVNLPPRNVLPNSIRKFNQPLDSTVIGNKKLFGRYRADLSVTYGESKKVQTSSIVFWVIPFRLIGAAVILLVGGFFGIRFGLQRYTQRILNKSRGRYRR